MEETMQGRAVIAISLAVRDQVPAMASLVTTKTGTPKTA
jgi:hypothetical protein